MSTLRIAFLQAQKNLYSALAQKYETQILIARNVEQLREARRALRAEERVTTPLQPAAQILRPYWIQKLSSISNTQIPLLRIPAGHFLMGSPQTELKRLNREGPQHQVELGEFFLARTPVTQAQWRAVAEWQPRPGDDPWPMELDPDPVARLNRAERFLGDQRPVVNVSWHDAMEFCSRLSQRSGKTYTLPSEAQWEYACRAGTTTPFHFGETISPELANYDGNFTYSEGKKGEYRRQTTDVASFPANAWGLHDMHGNVWEWCADDWHCSYEGAPTDGRPWLNEQATENGKLLRGGSWLDLPGLCRSAYRDWNHPGFHDLLVGFRVCCLPQDQLLYT
jgi:formylglycine-generating enzyme required for sulfatase activity